jgi:N utilization substance protein A
MESELLRLVDSIHRDKSIDKEIIFESIQEALENALRHKYREADDIVVLIGRETGDLSATIDGRVLDPKALGRIAAHGTRLNFSTSIKSAERDVVYTEFLAKKNNIVMGTVLRKELGFIIVNLGKAEGILPTKEQVFNERYKIGERIRVLVLAVEKKGQKVNIKLSRSHPDFVRNLFMTDVPEIADRTIEIKGIARDAGRRTKIALYSNDDRVDCVGSCVGVRGSRIKGIINELNGEKVDIVKFDNALEIYIVNVMSPAAVSQIELDKESFRARVVVPDEQYSLAIGKKGQNIRLASQLTKCHLDVITTSSLLKENLVKKLQFQKIPFLTESEIDSMIISGIETIEEAFDKGIEGLVKFNFINRDKAIEILGYCRQVLDGEIDDITTEDMDAIEKKIRSQTSKELVFNLPPQDLKEDDDDAKEIQE